MPDPLRPFPIAHARPALDSMPASGKAALLGLVVFATAWACLVIADRTGGVSPLWLANGYGVALLLLGAPARLRIALPVAFFAIAAANIAAGGAIPVSGAMVAVNVAEIAGVYLAMRRWRVRPSSPGGLWRFVGIAAAASASAAAAPARC